MKSLRFSFLFVMALGLAIIFCAPVTLLAGSATWSTNPASGDWNTAANWMPAAVPNGPKDIASFATSNTTNLSLSAAVEVDSVVFQAGSKAFTIKMNAAVSLTMSGAGVSNSSGVVQNFYSTQGKTSAGAIYFTNSATAGDSVVYTNKTLPNAGASPLIQFEDSASAGNSQFMNEAASFGSRAGLIEFQGNSTAASGTFSNTGVGDEAFPTINFRDQASAGQAVFTNEGGSEGAIYFYDTSTADQATFTIEAGIGALFFYGHASAGNATIINEGGNWGRGGGTVFDQSSTAGNANITAGGSLGGGYGNAEISFGGGSSAGAGTFIANGAEAVGDLTYGGSIVLDSSGSHGTFIANGGTVAGAKGGTIEVENFATAGQGTFTANGAAIDGALGGRIEFTLQAPTAGNSTLIATAGMGTADGTGGGIVFEDESTGGQARVEIFGNGFLDLRALDVSGLTIGSLEGDGSVFLGGVNLSIGNNNSSTTFSGVIEENRQGTTGSLSKIGTGTLTLSGASTYSGGSTVTAGALIVSNLSGSATGTGNVAVNGGTLGGGGIIAGAVTVGTGSGSGAILQPAFGTAQKVTMTIQSLFGL